MASQHCCQLSFFLYLLIVAALVLFAGLMSGLTLGLMSLGLVDLEVLVKSGEPKDRKHAAKIMPLVKNQHLLLCTLLVCNALAMEALPIFLDELVPSWGAILISVTLILMFGEILPQAICSRHGLAIGATMAPVVYVLVWICSPITYPISKLLDCLLGKDHVALFRRAELKTLVTMHGNEAGIGGELTRDETTIIAGALELTEKSAADAMTPISSTFCIDINAPLNKEMLNMMLEKGHSRIPVYVRHPTNIVGVILVKNLIGIQPADELFVRDVTIRKIPRVSEKMPLYDILNEFQNGHSHMAVVVKYSKEKEEALNQGQHMSQGRRLNSIKNTHRVSSLDKNKGIVSGDHVVEVPNSDNSQAEYHNSEQDRMRKGLKLRKGASGDVLKLDAVSLENFADDEEVVGIITMEDVIEELLQEEILDETDLHIDAAKLRAAMSIKGGNFRNAPMHSIEDASEKP